MTEEDFKRIYKQTRILFYITGICTLIGIIIGCKQVVMLGIYIIFVMFCCYVFIKKFPNVNG